MNNELKITFLAVFLLATLCVSAQSSSDILAYISRFKQIALDQERSFSIPAPITLAQGILESGAGTSTLTKNSNNHFGIKKGNDWTGPLVYAWDDDPTKSPFRKYSSPEESFKDHSHFLRNNSRYRDLFSKSVFDYRGWANGLQRAGYATSPTYAKALIGIIDAYKLYAVNGGVKLRPGKMVTISRTITREKLQNQTDIQIEEDEKSEEEVALSRAVNRYMVENNGVRCTILYPGMMLSTISLRYDIPKSLILEYNEISNEQDLKEGDIVYLEKKKKKYTGPRDIYRVRADDTLYSIAQQFGIRTENLAKINKKDFFASLQEGETIKLK